MLLTYISMKNKDGYMRLCLEEHVTGVKRRFLKNFCVTSVMVPVEPIDSPLEGPMRDVRRI